MSLILPSRQAENLRSTERPLKGEGKWEGTIESCEVRVGPPVNTKNGQMLQGFVGPEARRLSIVIGNNNPLDGQNDVGGQKEFVDLTLEDGPYSLRTTPYSDIPNEAWQLQRSARVIANLAVAKGEFSVDGEMAEISDEFLDRLEGGAYIGDTLQYEIYHRVGKDKVKRPEISRFL